MRITGRDLMLAVDLSGSMKRRDMQVGKESMTRLDVVKGVAGEFIERRHGDRIGLILFGTRAYLQAPLTFDRPTVRTLLEEAVIGLAGEQTAIGDAIGLGVKRLRDRPAQNRVLILLTDGANTAGEVGPMDARKTEELGQIYRTLDELEPVIGDEEQYRPTTELFYWPLAVALFLAASLLAGGGPRTWLSWLPGGRQAHG